MPTIGGLEPTEKYNKTVILSVVCAVLALGYHFRDELTSLVASHRVELASPYPPRLSPPEAASSSLSLAPQPEPPAAVPEPTEPTETEETVEQTPPEEAPVSVGLYVALRDTPVRKAPADSAPTVAFIHQGQRFLVVGGSGAYFEIRSINRTQQNPPGFVLQADAVATG